MELFRPLRGRYVWSVRVGEGALLTMELGNPRLEVAEVRHDGIPHRAVRPRGQWQLSLGECAFELQVGDLVVDESSEVDALERAAERLDGQALLFAEERDGVLRLELDLGAVLTVTPLGEGVAWVLASEDALYGWSDGSVVRLTPS